MERLFVSSVQKEFAEERRALAKHVRSDPLLKQFFEVFLFEELPPKDRKADDLYLAKVDQAAVYVGLFGGDYGAEDTAGVSPTEHEFDRATARGIPRLVLVKGDDDSYRHPKMRALIWKASGQLVRRRFGSIDEMLRLLQSSLVDHLEGRGAIQHRPFDQRPCLEATLADIDPDLVARFVRRARAERKFPLAERSGVAEVLEHLRQLHDGKPTMAAILLFGRDPRRHVPAAEIRCMHFHGTEVARPAPSYQVFAGTLFDQVDRGVDFVLSKLNRTVGTRALGPQAPVMYDVPPDVVHEAIVNAVAHRDYTSVASVQVSVFADRVEVWNPGALPPELTPESLRKPHPSIPRNAGVCEAMFLTRHIERFGTGTLMMIQQSARAGLPAPSFEQRGATFVVTVWRDWLTDEVMARLGFNERQRRVVAYVRQHGRVTNRDFAQMTGVTDRTVLRDLEELVAKGVFDRVGSTGRGTHYVMRRETRRKPDKPDMGAENARSGTKGATKGTRAAAKPTRAPRKPKGGTR